MKSRPSSSELHSGPGFRLRRDIERPAADLVARLSTFPTPDISDRMNRMYTVSTDIKNRTGSARVCGPACTVQVYPGDNLMVHKALDVAQPGDVVVVYAGNSMNGIVGDMIAAKAKHRGIQGFIVDGLIRDVQGIREVDLPVFARGVTPIGPLHRGPGELNFPVSCGGVVVRPGDVVVGDENGVVVVAQDFLFDVVTRLEERSAALEEYTAKVRRGEFSNDWVDRTLSEGGCEGL